MGVAEDPRQLNVHLASLYSIRCNLHKMDCKVVFVQICMYACMHVCMHACMYACMYVYVCVCICVCLYVCICVCTSACTYACTYVCMYFCVCMYACMHVCMYLCVCMWIVYVCVRACVCAFVCPRTAGLHVPGGAGQAQERAGVAERAGFVCQLWPKARFNCLLKYTSQTHGLRT